MEKKVKLVKGELPLNELMKSELAFILYFRKLLDVKNKRGFRDEFKIRYLENSLNNYLNYKRKRENNEN